MNDMDARTVAAFVVNYNMPERADHLAIHIAKNSDWPVDVFVIDNGSDLVGDALTTTIWLQHNVQTTCGWLSGLEQAVDLEGKDYFAYWFLITSGKFVDQEDVLTPMAQLLWDDAQAVGVHPALTSDSTTAWKHLYDRGTGEPRQTWMIDNIASLYRAKWFDRIGRFDEELIYGWGIDLETCWKARSMGYSLWVDERVQIRKDTDIGYAMGRMRMSAEQRRARASENMAEVLSWRYGENWNWKMREEFVEEWMR